MAATIKWIIVVLMIPPAVVAFAFSPPAYFLTFLAAAVIPFFSARSRRVTDPVAGIPTASVLAPQDFHAWAKLVCATDEYQRAYNLYMYDADRGYDQKLPLVFSQIKAINYVHAWKILLLILLTLNAFCLYDLFYSNQAFRAPVAMGAMIGILWGYAIGVFALWRQCRRHKKQGDLPL